MAEKSTHRHSDKLAYRILLQVLEASALTTFSQPKELTIMEDQLSALRSKGQSPPINDPVSLYRVMALLRKKGSPKMSDISRGLSVSLSTATRIAEFLVDCKYAERSSDPNDGRLVRLTLTQYGNEVHDAIEGFLLQRVRKILDCLTIEEQTIYVMLADKMRASLKRDATHKRYSLQKN
jgi:DNA-binding MarR family transcriptional regulator